MRISDWSSDVCSSDLETYGALDIAFANAGIIGDMGGIFDFDPDAWAETLRVNLIGPALMVKHAGKAMVDQGRGGAIVLTASVAGLNSRSEEHTSELQSLMRISYAVFCLKKKKQHTT